jgi:hypothetical protein
MCLYLAWIAHCLLHGSTCTCVSIRVYLYAVITACPARTANGESHPRLLVAGGMHEQMLLLRLLVLLSVGALNVVLVLVLVLVG